MGAADLGMLPWGDQAARVGLVAPAGLEEAAPGKDLGSKAEARFRVGSPAAVAQGQAAECFVKP